MIATVDNPATPNAILQRFRAAQTQRRFVAFAVVLSTGDLLNFTESDDRILSTLQQPGTAVAGFLGATYDGHAVAYHPDPFRLDQPTLIAFRAASARLRTFTREYFALWASTFRAMRSGDVN